MNRLAFPRFERFLGNICSFQQIYRKKSLGVPGMKVSNDSSVDMLPRDDRVCLSKRLRCFFSGIINTGGVRHDPQRFMGKIVAAPHFNRDTVKFA